jgi:hypothetical protein
MAELLLHLKAKGKQQIFEVNKKAKTVGNILTNS